MPINHELVSSPWPNGVTAEDIRRGSGSRKREKESLRQTVKTLAWAKLGRRTRKEGLKASQILENAGIPEEILGLLIKRETVSMTDCDSLWLGPTVSGELAEETSRRLKEIDLQLSVIADSHGLTPELRKELNIATQQK